MIIVSKKYLEEGTRVISDAFSPTILFLKTYIFSVLVVITNCYHANYVMHMSSCEYKTNRIVGVDLGNSI